MLHITIPFDKKQKTFKPKKIWFKSFFKLLIFNVFTYRQIAFIAIL